MPTTQWVKTVNFFIPLLLRSYISTKEMLNYVNLRLLNADSDLAILALYTIFNPLNTA